MNRRDFLRITFAGTATVAVPSLASGETTAFIGTDIAGDSVATFSLFDTAGKLLGEGKVSALVVAKGKISFGFLSIDADRACTLAEFRISSPGGHEAIRGSIGTSDGDLRLTSTHLITGDQITIPNFTINAGDTSLGRAAADHIASLLGEGKRIASAAISKVEI